VGVARGSLAEVEMQIEIAKNLDYVSQESCSKLLSRIDEVGRLLTGMRTWSAKPERSG
jgi:four helix bundle protein